MIRVMLGIVALTVGCGSSAEEVLLDADDESETEALSAAFVGSYSVPVSDPELAAEASYPVDRIQFRARAQTVKLAYDLPAELVGTKQRVSMRGSVGSDGEAVLQGPRGTARCEQVGAGWDCHETLPGVSVDLAKVEERVGPGPRLDVAKAFIVDPIGILHIERARK